MTAKKTGSHTARAGAGDFQLDPKEFHIHNMLIDPIIDKVVAFANSEDFNEDGRPDIAQYAPYLQKALPILAELSPLLHSPSLLNFLATLPIWKDGEAAKAAIAKLSPILTEAAALHAVTPGATVAPKSAVESDILHDV